MTLRQIKNIPIISYLKRQELCTLCSKFNERLLTHVYHIQQTLNIQRQFLRYLIIKGLELPTRSYSENPLPLEIPQ